MYKTHITQYLDDNAAAYPERVAVIDGEKQLTLGDLRARALVLAGAFFSINSERQHIIAVFLPKGQASVIAYVAINYTGNAYMNLDIRSPRERVRNILNAIKPSLVIADSSTADFISSIAQDIPILLIDDEHPQLTHESIQHIIKKRDSCLDTDLL